MKSLLISIHYLPNNGPRAVLYAQLAGLDLKGHLVTRGQMGSNGSAVALENNSIDVATRQFDRILEEAISPSNGRCLSEM